MTVLLLASLGCHEPVLPEPDLTWQLPQPAPGAWPRLDAVLHPLPPPTSPGQVLRVAIDPGHGTGSNHGATGVLCDHEMDSNLSIARDLVADLEDVEWLEVHMLRDDADGPSYGTRLRQAERWQADLLISLHADVRGLITPWSPDGLQSCPRNDAEPGFAVLVRDQGAAEDRLRLARTVASSMTEVGLVAYDGVNYTGLYEIDPIDGVFLDRRGLMMLRRASMPAIIIETHHSLYLEEWVRWREEDTRHAFASAVITALAELAPELGRT